MFTISIKNDIVLSHIESLEAGTKISVRGLASELDVSEGTVYKAIKEAEIRGYVITKPKSGTFRVEKSVGGSEFELTLFEIVSAMGLSCLAGKKYLDSTVEKIIICDGNEKQLADQLEACNARRALCIVGDRPDLQTVVVQYGANMLLTGGCRPTDYHIVKAEKRGTSILSALQSTYTIVKLFDSQFFNRAAFGEDNAVSEWMQTPSYLYHNDIVADWQHFYHDSFSGMKYYPVVDDDLKVKGGINISQTFVASNSQKLSSLIADNANVLQVDAADTVHEVAQKMLFSGSPYAVVTRAGRMDGIIYPLDLVRYFAATQTDDHPNSLAPSFSFIPDMSSEDRKVYELQVRNEEIINSGYFSTGTAVYAAINHLTANGHPECTLESSSFFYPAEITDAKGLMLSTSVSPAGKHHFSVEIEIYSDSDIYMKGLLVFSEADRR